MKKIIRNIIKCKKCGEILESNNTHDFKTCGCGSVSVDGGLEYLKREGDLNNIEELSICEN